MTHYPQEDILNITKIGIPAKLKIVMLPGHEEKYTHKYLFDFCFTLGPNTHAMKE